MEKNKKFFCGKTWDEILNELKFDSYLNELKKKLKNKKVILYGAGTMLDFIVQNYDLSGLDIQAVSDKKYETSKDSYFGYKTIPPIELNDSNVDAIIICTQYPYCVYTYLKNILTKGSKPKFYFLLNKPLKLYVEEIFN